MHRDMSDSNTNCIADSDLIANANRVAHGNAERVANAYANLLLGHRSPLVRPANRALF